MRVYFFTLFLTFVVTSPLAQAAPSTTTKMETQPLSGQSDPVLADKVYLSTLEKPPTSQMGISLGYGGGPYLEKENYIVSPNLRVTFSPLENDLPKWEYSLEVNSENALGIFLGQRWYCCPEDDYLPYYRVSLGSFFDANAGLANFAEIRRLRARGAFGVGKKFFTEIGGGLAVTGADIFLQFGYQFKF